MPCFYDAVIPTLETDWETGAVIEEEVVPNNRWEIGPCSSDGMLTRTYVLCALLMFVSTVVSNIQ